MTGEAELYFLMQLDDKQTLFVTAVMIVIVGLFGLFLYLNNVLIDVYLIIIGVLEIALVSGFLYLYYKIKHSKNEG